MSNLEQKKGKAFYAIFAAVVGSGITGTSPTPNWEIPKQLGLVAGDIGLCLGIYQIYFSDQLSEQRLIDLLTEAGILTVTSGVLAYCGVRATQALLKEFMNFFGPISWIVSGTLTGLQTLTLGLFWWNFCHQKHINDEFAN